MRRFISKIPKILILLRKIEFQIEISKIVWDVVSHYQWLNTSELHLVRPLQKLKIGKLEMNIMEMIL